MHVSGVAQSHEHDLILHRTSDSSFRIRNVEIEYAIRRCFVTSTSADKWILQGVQQVLRDVGTPAVG
eukprot:m.97122 g.97122  ORF g.97122 m.97122 type:complete len:67 (+) comp14816_c1_seq2:1705-1905(+)